MKIKPLNDWVVIQPVDAEEKTAGGLFIPEKAKEKPQVGVVEAVGPGRYKADEDKGKDKKKDKKFIPTEVKRGDKVLYEKYMISDIEVDGKTVVMVREEYILGVLE
ncbi:MAG: hypothetical protein A2X59_12730 [Nitrospirae bacterium GWC2_42_7]|nr:MAG: hypothetical protein A2X59_12730 [Nitrospirae bacterium GWC2_42_7]